jgi:undecaprenyl phosphate-alpha-L-ara4FN deformylase
MNYIDVALRIDIDTVKDAENVPSVVRLLDEMGITGTFFVTTGMDTTYKNFRNNLNPLRLKGKVSQYGLGQMFRGLLIKEHVERTKGLEVLINSEHEIGLHGHDHFEWMNHLDSMDSRQLHGHFETGIRLFEKKFGFRPNSFASPGFNTNDLSLEIMEHFNFQYASDFRGTKIFHSNESTLQIPVALPSFGEMGSTFSDEEILKKYCDMLNSSDEFFVFYIHPSYEPVFKQELLKKLLYYIKDNERFDPVTMSQIAGKYKHEDPSDI